MLTKGLLKEPNTARDADWLAQSDYAVGYAGALATVPDLAPVQLDLTGISAQWPFPQVARLARVTFVFTETSIYALRTGIIDELELVWSGEKNLNKWAAADFLIFIVLSNGKDVLEYDLELGVVRQAKPFNVLTDEGSPAFRACLNYNSQLLIGGIHVAL
jgi:hypothetical protein